MGERRSPKRSVRTAVLFSVAVFFVIVCTMLLSIGTLMMLFRFGLLPRERIEGLPLIIFAVACALVGTFLSRLIGRKPIGAIEEISRATQEIARGNFDVRLNMDTRMQEIAEMSRNFNRMAEELSHIEMFRNDFIENVSHEFKTPLTAIDGYVTLLQSPHLTEEKRALYTDKILQNTRRLSALTGNVLLLSRLEHQEYAMQKEEFPLDEQLRECILLYEKQWIEKELDVDVALDSVSYMGNLELLNHVWQNLLGNAIKFTPDGGMIRVTLSTGERCVTITVEDSGVGMDEATITRIYEKFYQGDRSHTGSGNGLGLALVKRIVDLHGGTITVQSTPGMGSVFTVTLPQN